MSIERRLADAFIELRSQYRTRAKRDILSELEGLIADDDELREAIFRRRLPSAPLFMVTFDRRKNDATFSYQYADLVLVALDRLQGGSGVYKPLNQLRVIRWNAAPADLLNVLKLLSRSSPQLKFYRLLVAPYAFPPTGHRLDPRVHRR